MRSLGHLLSFGGGRTATLIVFAVAAGSIPLRADMVCMGDCEQPTCLHGRLRAAYVPFLRYQRN